jgi:predicted hydrocarbon binding protein
MADQLPKEERKVVLEFTVRLLMDTLDDLLGEHGRVSIFNYAGLSALNRNPPRYSFTAAYTLKDQLAMYRGVIEIVGLCGAKSLLRRVGIGNIKNAVKMGVFDHLTGLPEARRHEEALKVFAVSVGMGRLDYGTDKIVFSFPTCRVCNDVRDTKPFCTIFEGAIAEITRWATPRKFLIEETRCRAMGDETCEFELRQA